MSLFDNSKVEEKSSIKPAIKVVDCRLTAIKNGETKEGKKYIDFEFVEQSTKSTVRDRIFEPIDKTSAPPFPDYSFEAEVNKTTGRILHILGRYVAPETAKGIKGETWDDYIKNVINAFPAGYKEIPCDLSVVYVYNKSENKDYVGLRRFPPFISTSAYPREFPEKLWDNESLTGLAKGGANTASSTPGAPTGAAPASADEI